MMYHCVKCNKDVNRKAWLPEEQLCVDCWPNCEQRMTVLRDKQRQDIEMLQKEHQLQIEAIRQRLQQQIIHERQERELAVLAAQRASLAPLQPYHDLLVDVFIQGLGYESELSLVPGMQLAVEAIPSLLNIDYDFEYKAGQCAGCKREQTTHYRIPLLDGGAKHVCVYCGYENTASFIAPTDDIPF